MKSRTILCGFASLFVKNSLPAFLFPKKLKILSCGLYTLGPSKKSGAIWVVEYEVNDDSPIIGIGVPSPTLFIPLDRFGEVLVTVTTRTGF